MSIHDEILDCLNRGMIFPVVPKAAGAPIRRALFVEEQLWKELNSPEGDAEYEERIGRLRADLETFVTEASIVPKYLFLLYRATDAVWEIRCVRPEVSGRVLGLFPDRDILVTTNFAWREWLGKWQSREWKQVKRIAKAVWRKLFKTYVPIVTTDINTVITGAVNGRYYKERG